MGTSQGTAGDLDLPQGEKERGKILGELLKIADPLSFCRFSIDPAMDGPWAGVTVARLPDGERLGDGKRKLRSEHRQPPGFLGNLGHIMLGTRKPHGHVGAEMEGAVVPTALVNRGDGQMAPVRELIGNEPFDELAVDHEHGSGSGQDVG